MTLPGTALAGAEVDALVDRVDLGRGVVAGFTRAAAGNLSHRRPHLPSALARRRARVAEQFDVATADLHFMEQVHGAAVGIVTADTTRGAEIRDVDVLATAEPARALAVQVADCTPVLLASDTAVAAVHAGRAGLAAGAVEAGVQALEDLTGHRDDVRAAIGPAIGACCYEVPPDMRDDVARTYPNASAETTWGTPSLDIPRAVRDVLEGHGIRVATDWMGCTRCDPRRRWFSHRRDEYAGRQLGVVVRMPVSGADTRHAEPA